MSEVFFHYDQDRARAAIQLLDKISMTTIFLIDREHLVLYGRPVFGGLYFAGEHGPVNVSLETDLVDNPDYKPDPENYLSVSDREILASISKSYNQPLTLQAWAKNLNRQIPYEDFFLDLPEKYQAELMWELIQEDYEARLTPKDISLELWCARKA
jgi:hypothetical protein